MKKPVALIGIGEMGGVFARGVLKMGYPVYPVTRNMNLTDAAKDLPETEAVINAVGEKDLPSTLDNLPDAWGDKIILLQNELLPKDWTERGLTNPTVISVWFEKKQPNDYKVIIPSPVYGPKAQFIADALGAINISTKVLKDEGELLFELIVKNLYILTTNISGLKVGGNVGELWGQHQELARAVANDIMDIQFALVQQEFPREPLIEAMVKAFEGDLDHKCMGRSAPARLERALSQAEQAGLKVETLRTIQAPANNV